MQYEIYHTQIVIFCCLPWYNNGYHAVVLIGSQLFSVALKSSVLIAISCQWLPCSCSQWFLMVWNGFQWLSVLLNGFQWFSMVLIGCTSCSLWFQKFNGFNGSQCFSMVLSGSEWFSMLFDCPLSLAVVVNGLEYSQ